MYNKIKQFIKLHWDLVSYMFFGGLTTAINYLVYLPCFNLLGLSAVSSNVIAWAVSVLFAFVTNKCFVFHSGDWSMGVVMAELGKFVGCRLGSGLMETAALWLMVDYFSFNGNWMKLVLSVLVVVLNYVASKLLVFRKK